MSDTDDDWPGYYGASYAKHLHALGVIAVSFATLQVGLDSMYLRGAANRRVPPDLARTYYFSINEEKRIAALKTIYSQEDKSLVEMIDNLIDFFQWCQHCRNNLLHAEPYPVAIGRVKDVLYLTKRVSKTSDKAAYIKLSLAITPNRRSYKIWSSSVHTHILIYTLSRYAKKQASR
jgi:hypothetical protein